MKPWKRKKARQIRFNRTQKHPRLGLSSLVGNTSNDKVMTGRVEKVKQHKFSRTKVLELAGMVEQRSVSRNDEVFRVIRLSQMSLQLAAQACVRAGAITLRIAAQRSGF